MRFHRGERKKNGGAKRKEKKKIALWTMELK